MATDDPPGPLCGAGRSADVYDVGGGRVLRRYRDLGASAEREAEVMRIVGAAGYPVPEVFDASGPDLVMERLSGPTLLDDLGKRPWTLWSGGTLLADLHRWLHEIDASALAAGPLADRRIGDADQLVHLDLHPDNVVLTPDRGPVVIDWANAVIGDGAADVAYVWIVLTIASVPSGRMPGWVAAGGRRVLRHSFLRNFDRDRCARALVGLVEAGSIPTRNFDATELARLDELVASLRGAVD